VRRLVLPVAAACVVVAGVLVAAVVWPDSASRTVDDALAVMPADAELVMFTDAAAARERLGYGDLTSESSQGEVDEFITASLDSRRGGRPPWEGPSR
jgi:hypothetical protein